MNTAEKMRKETQRNIDVFFKDWMKEVAFGELAGYIKALYDVEKGLENIAFQDWQEVHLKQMLRRLRG